eukprot:3826296-Rhodomonas_salina.4
MQQPSIRQHSLIPSRSPVVLQAVERLLITKIDSAGGAKGGMLVEESLREKQVATVVDSKVRRIHASLATFFQVPSQPLSRGARPRIRLNPVMMCWELRKRR